MSSIIATAWRQASACASQTYESTTNWMKNHPTTVRVASTVATVGLTALAVYGAVCLAQQGEKAWKETCEAAGKECARRFVNDMKLLLLEARDTISTNTPEGKTAHAELVRIIENVYKHFPA